MTKKKKQKKKIMNCANNACHFSLDQKINKSLILDNILAINKDNNLELTKKNGEMIVTNSSKKIIQMRIIQ